jgi:hypothetical protein
MAVAKGYRFPIEFADAFPRGLVLMGDVAPDNEYQTREDRTAGRPVRQRTDERTGKRQWKATVTDPDEPNAKRASFEVTFIADVQPYVFRAAGFRQASSSSGGARPPASTGRTASGDSGDKAA